MLLKDRLAFAWLLKAKGISYRQLATAAGWTSPNHVSNLVHGRKNSVTPESANRIAQRLGVPVEDLFRLRITTDTGQQIKRRRAA